LAVDLFADAEHGGFFLAPASPSGDGAAPPLPRTKDLDDTPIPSGNSMLAHVLLRLGRLWGDDELERLAAGVLRLVASGMQRLPTAFGWALCALHLYLAPRRELAVVGGVEAPVARAALRPFQPATVVAVAASGGADAVRVCLMVEGQEGVTWEEWVALARAAEQAGLEALFRSDHYTAILQPQAGSLDAWATLAGLAPLTTRLRLGTMVSPATFRHPSVLA